VLSSFAASSGKSPLRFLEDILGASANCVVESLDRNAGEMMHDCGQCPVGVMSAAATAGGPGGCRLPPAAAAAQKNICMSATLVGAFALLVTCAHAADFYSGTKVKVLTEASFNDLVRGGDNGGWLVEF
jgi:hypothetical protein